MNENGDKKLTEYKSSGYGIASLFVTSCSNISFFACLSPLVPTALKLQGNETHL